MNRTDLERLDRDTLISRAEASGVTRARILTRPELIDELLVKSSAPTDDVARVRGFFGRARDLLARVVERGLHLPDAADRLRGRSSPPPPLRSTAAPLPTVTLAEIYAAQGHRERAVETLRTVLDREPEHAAARTLLERLEDAAYDGPKAPELPPEDEIFASRPPPPLAREPAPRAFDECNATPVDPQTLRITWEMTDATRAHHERTRPAGVVALRALVIAPTWDGPATDVRDVLVHAQKGDSLVGGLPVGAVVRVAVGWRVGEDFVPVAHSPALAQPRQSHHV